MKKYKTQAYTDFQVQFILDQRNNGLDYVEISIEFNRKFKPSKDKSPGSIRSIYERFSDFELSEDEMIKNIKLIHSTRKSNSRVRKENALILNEIDRRECIVSEISEVFKKSKINKVKVEKAPKRSKKKKNMGVELFVSDIHVGLKTKSYNLDVCENRIKKYTKDTLADIKRKQLTHNITKIQLNFAGDLIQGEHLHGPDSQHSCEFSDAKQMAEAIRVLYYRLIVPICSLGIQVNILGIAGNHDRQSKDRPITNAGERYLTYTIYKSLEMLCDVSGLSNTTWEIPIKEYSYFEMFGHNFIVEHGHAAGIKPNSAALEKQLLKRANQLGIIAKGIRIGHFHGSLCSNNGRHIVGPSPVSDDCFGDHLGYISYPAMMINYYVETVTRTTSFYHSFDVNLENVK